MLENLEYAQSVFEKMLNNQHAKVSDFFVELSNARSGLLTAMVAILKAAEARKKEVEPIDERAKEIIFVDQLRTRRIQKKMSQSDLAKAAGVSRNYISKIERGEIDNVSFIVFFKICYALELVYQVNGKPFEAYQDRA